MQLLLFLVIIVAHFYVSDTFKKYTGCCRSNRIRSRRLFATSIATADGEADVVVIGSGIAGLSCAALLSHVNYKVVVLESHEHFGGCAHSWQRLGYHFEAGPSLYSGFSSAKSPNPLKNIFQVIGEEPEFITYDRWGTVLPEGKFAARLGPQDFHEVLLKYGGPGAVEDWNKLATRMIDDDGKKNGLSIAAQALPSLAIREDPKVVISLARFLRRTIRTFSQGQALNTSFKTIRDELGIKNPFVINWLDMLCFLLQGVPADGTLNAVIAYMFGDWCKPEVSLDYPKGGSSAIVQALIRGIVKNGKSQVIGRKHVEEVIIESNRAVGVKYIDNSTARRETKVIRAKKAIVSNIDIYNTRKIVRSDQNQALDVLLDNYISNTPKLHSFIHLHAGIDATGLPTQPSANFPCQWAVVNKWGTDSIEEPRNVVLVSMPSLIDRSMAPTNKHVIHAYTPATERYDDWQGLSSEEYERKKADAADFLWSAVERYIPDARQRSDHRVEQIGTPCTHEKFLRRSYGSYGPRIIAGDETAALARHKTPLPGFYLAGDYSFPGIGVPAAATSGAIAANTIMSLREHLRILDKLDAYLPDI